MGYTHSTNRGWPIHISLWAILTLLIGGGLHTYRYGLYSLLIGVAFTHIVMGYTHSTNWVDFTHHYGIYSLY